MHRRTVNFTMFSYLTNLAFLSSTLNLILKSISLNTIIFKHILIMFFKKLLKHILLNSCKYTYCKRF